jgi:hypothetical protein
LAITLAAASPSDWPACIVVLDAAPTSSFFALTELALALRKFFLAPISDPVNADRWR